MDQERDRLEQEQEEHAEYDEKNQNIEFNNGDPTQSNSGNQDLPTLMEQQRVDLEQSLAGLAKMKEEIAEKEASGMDVTEDRAKFDDEMAKSFQDALEVGKYGKRVNLPQEIAPEFRQRMEMHLQESKANQEQLRDEAQPKQEQAYNQTQPKRGIEQLQHLPETEKELEP